MKSDKDRLMGIMHGLYIYADKNKESYAFASAIYFEHP